MNSIYDLIIIGGGPAGMMAAISAKTHNEKTNVLILEKNDVCGKKLLITGKGRCNVTTAISDTQEFIDKLGKKAKWLRDSLNSFSVSDTMAFFRLLGIELHEERGKRIFPATENAIFVRNKLIKKIIDQKIDIQYNSTVNIIEKDEHFNISTKSNKKYISKNILITTGGLSYPTTGSSGDGYTFAEKFGIKIIKPTPALIGLITKDSWVKKLSGLTLKHTSIEVYQSNKKQDERFGDLLLTYVGISGPIIIDMSKNIHHLMTTCSDPVYLHIDLKPAVTHKQLDKRLQLIFSRENKKLLKNILGQLLPEKMIDSFIEITELDPNRTATEVTKEERKKIVNTLKKLIITPSDVEGFDKAVITAGGVALKEISPKTMESKSIPGLYLAGEIIDLDAPTGGFNLQIAWSTGYLAGKSISESC